MRVCVGNCAIKQMKITICWDAEFMENVELSTKTNENTTDCELNITFNMRVCMQNQQI